MVYNVTVKIDLSVHDDWLAWMKSKHIPDVMNTGFFTSYKLMRILAMDETDGISYAIQYTCNSMEDYNAYQHTNASELQKEHTARYKDKFVAFRTLMRVV